jgi:hypothetical protein
MSESATKPEDLTPVPMIQQRRIEAAMLKHVYDILKDSHGEQVARDTVANAVRKSSVEQAQEYAAKVGGKTSLRTFIERGGLWRVGGALQVEVLEQSEKTYSFNVVRCKYSEMYREMGLGEIGHLLSCMRDGTFCEGYDPKLKLERTQTIMQGASHCDFRYTYEDEKA